jgi:hypothetical protein
MNSPMDLFLGRTLTGMTEVWLAVAYLACLFTVLAFRPQQIGSPGLFGVACVLFGCYLVVPALGEAVIYLTSITDLPDQRQRPLDPSARLVGWGMIVPLCQVMARVILGASIVCALGSMRRGLPRRLDQAESH